MYPYLRTARRYRWLLIAVLVIVWSAGLAAAYVEYTTTYQADTTVWVQRASPELAQTSVDDPNLPVIQTAASQQAELFSQLLRTDSFLEYVLGRTTLRTPAETDRNATQPVEQVRGRFRIQTLGTHLFVVSYTDRDPHTAVQMLKSAFAVREQRVAESRLAASTALTTLYKREFDVAQSQALDAQKALDEFNATHKAPLSEIDQHRQDQLRLTLDFAQVRLGDLKGRVDQSVLAPAILDVSGLEFQIVDEPREERIPRGGARPAAMIAAVALIAGAFLAAFLVLVGTLIGDQPVMAADVGRLAPATIFATVPRLAGPGDLRAALAATAFGNGDFELARAAPRVGDTASEGKAWR